MLDLHGLEQHEDLLESLSFDQFPILVNPRPNDLGDLTDRARVIRQDVFRFIREGALTPLDIVYLAPPQYRGLWAGTLRALDSHEEMLKPEGLIIAPMHSKEYRELSLETLGLQERRIYGSTLLCFYSLKEPGQEPS